MAFGFGRKKNQVEDGDNTESTLIENPEDYEGLSERAKTTGVNEDGEVVDYNQARQNVKPDLKVGQMVVAGEPGQGMTAGSSRVSVDGALKRSSSRSINFEELDKAFEELKRKRAEENRNDDDDDLIDISKLSKTERKAMAAAMADRISAYPHLLALKPLEGYVFHSDYFEVDGQFATIVAFFHNDAANDTFGAFWGINRIPPELGPGITTVTIQQISRMTDKWVEDHLATSEKIDKLQDRDVGDAGGRSAQRKAAKIASDMTWATAEIQDGASYLNVQDRLIVRAPSLEELDEAMIRLKQVYIDVFPSITTAPYHGEQRSEMSKLMDWNKNKHGKGYGFTSTEFAGSYSLVTNGLNDPAGEYVGDLFGDVNRSAILLDVNRYKNHVVIADETVNPMVFDQRFSDMWASKLSQAAQLGGGRVVHLVLNNVDLDLLGPAELKDQTAYVDMTKGEINMLELFGDVDDELALFQVHIRKLVLMTAQLLKAGVGDQSHSLQIVTGQLSKVLTQFYIDQGMWVDNAKEHRDRLRLVGLPHGEVPLLHVFRNYIDSAYATANRKGERQFSEALGELSMVFGNLLDANSDLFDQITDDRIDHVNDSRRVVYSFSGLNRRSPGIAMAQLINVVNFAVESLGKGDSVVIHGADAISDMEVQEFLLAQFGRLRQRGGRVVFSYDSVETMLNNSSFNRFDKADYTVLGPMGDATVMEYQAQLQQVIPRDMVRQITARDSGRSYLRRGATNVIFRTNLSLGIRDVMQERLRSQREARVKENQVLFNRKTDTSPDSARDSGGGGATAITDGHMSESGALARGTETVDVDQANRESRMKGRDALVELRTKELKAASDGLEAVGIRESEMAGEPRYNDPLPTENGSPAERDKTLVRRTLGSSHR